MFNFYFLGASAEESRKLALMNMRKAQISRSEEKVTDALKWDPRFVAACPANVVKKSDCLRAEVVDFCKYNSLFKSNLKVVQRQFKQVFSKVFTVVFICLIFNVIIRLFIPLQSINICL